MFSSNWPKYRPSGSVVTTGRQRGYLGYGRQAMMISPRYPPRVGSRRPTARGRYRTMSSRRVGVRTRVVELKNWDQNLTMPASATLAFPIGAGVLAGPLGAPIIGLAQGTTQNQRIGRKVILRSVLIKARLLFTPGAAAGYDNATLKLVLDRQSNGVLPVAADLFQNATASNELRNLNSQKRFKVLKTEDVEFLSGAGVAGAYDPVEKTLDWYVKTNLPIMINSTLGAFSEFTENNIYLVFGSTQGLTTVAAGTMRIRYTDA